ncbi:MAG: T9SS type A sorting domain-containing protein [bacterium]|nr:T9SS type A sorting domain-containing protein [bacterium]
MKKLWTVCILLVCVATAAFASYGKEEAARDLAQSVTLEKALAYKEQGLPMTAEMVEILTAYYAELEARDSWDGLDAQGGPDTFGYRYVDNQSPDTVVYQWIELCDDPGATIFTLENGSLDDGYELAAPLGFSFPYYGTNYTTVDIGTNGIIHFSGTRGGATNSCINAASRNAFYPYYDDLHPGAAGTLGCTGTPGAGAIRYKSFGTYFVVEWKRIDPFSGTGISTFQCILFDNGKMKVSFSDDPVQHTHSSVGATIGIEDLAATNGVQYSCNTAGIVPGRSIVFYPPASAPTGRCCYLREGVATCEDLTSADCLVFGGQWGGAGTNCAANPCPTGRCCYLDGGRAACATTIQLECTALGGVWAAGLDCGTTPCPLGRCCYAAGCETNIDLECAALGGTWTTGLTCEANPCPVSLQGGEDCATAVAAPIGGTYLGTTVGAIDDDPNLWCGTGSSNTAGDVWYTVVGNGNTLTAETCQPTGGFDTQLAVYCGDCGVFTCIGSSDDACGARSSVTWCSAVGTTYYILVDGWSGNTGAFQLAILDGAACSNAIDCNPEGRCCYVDIDGRPACADVLAADCAVLGGEFNATMTCAANPCPVGSCCYTVPGSTICDPKACVDGIYASQCATLGGTWTLNGVCPDACPSSVPCVCECSLQQYAHATIAADLTTYPILDNGTVCLTINVPIEYRITDLNVCLDLVHTFDGDLVVALISPLGVVDTLSNRRGSGGDNYTCTTFDDEAATTIALGVPPYTGSFIPEQPLSVYDGSNAVGNWLLCVSDAANLDQGSVLGACLKFEYDIILSVNFGGFDAVANNSEVVLNWNTLSESNLASFELSRDGSVIANVPAENEATGAVYSFVDANVENGHTYSYSLVAVDNNGGRQELATVESTPAGAAVVTEYALHQNYPNPFNPTTNIAFDMVEAGHVTISVFNIMGQKVAELVNGSMDAGRHVVSFDAAGLSSGLYLYKMEANGFTAQSKMVLMK